MKKLLIFLSLMMLSFSMAATVHADLLDMGDGMIYDTELNITWYQNPKNNYMTWDDAMKWAAGLTVGGHRDWRLPTTPGTEDGYVNEGEMGHLYYETLNNDEDGPLANKGPFSNLEPYDYWSSMEFADNPMDFAWAFDFRTGRQRPIAKNSIAYGFAVRGGGNAPQRTSPGGNDGESPTKNSSDSSGGKSSY